jgi:hypothetical protein
MRKRAENMQRKRMGQLGTYKMRIYAERARVHEGARNGRMENEPNCRKKQ